MLFLCSVLFLYTLRPSLPVTCIHIITAAKMLVFFFLSTQLYFILMRENVLGLRQFLSVC